MDYSKQLFLLAEAIKTQPGSVEPVTMCPCPSGAGRWLTEPLHLTPEEGLLLWSPDQGTGLRQLALLLARGC